MSVLEIPIPVDRTSSLWLRLRSACQHSASYINLDTYTDTVYRTLCDRVGRYPANDGPGSASPAETRATRAKQEAL